MAKARGQHKEKALSAAAVRTITAPGMYADGNGLYLKIDRNGKRRWVQRLVVQGKRRDLSLGSARLTTLADARDQAYENRKVARTGGDPVQARARAAATPTFETLARELHDILKQNLREGKHRDRALRILEIYVFPGFGSKRVTDVNGADVLNALTPIWKAKPETARRAKQRLNLTFRYAIAKDWRNDNPMEKCLPLLPKHDSRAVRRMPALHYSEMQACLAAVKASRAMPQTKLAIEFVALTVGRSFEIRGAPWHEVDEQRAVWIIPEERMKGGITHRVPLVERALEILGEAKNYSDGTDLIFPGRKRGRPLSDVTLTKLIKELGFECVVHGFRSSFRDWAAECTNYPREVVEIALAHVGKDQVEAAYFRSDVFDKRRKLMDDWADYLAGKQVSGNVISFPGQRP